MTAAERSPWFKLWLRDLERGVGGPWNRDLSLAIDRAWVLLEATA